MAGEPQRVKSLFLAASDLTDPTERAAYLDRECVNDTELRAQVDALLRADDASPLPPLDERVVSQASADGDSTGASSSKTGGSIDSLAPPTDRHPKIELGLVIADRYALKEQIGEGGMGEVWAAKQSEPVKRNVALKLIKAGMDSKAVLQRFEQERQALGMMDHPNIARVLDGGITRSGQPFFVMELVNGLPLNRFCDEAKLSLRERLELFVPICQAVQHAHQKGIVHRDLKPANILITIIDGRAIPKVIDFGVAKAVSGKLTDESMFTQFGAILGTLEYMSPEQAGYSGSDIDTRSDIYSLGVILYELLSGLRPIDAGRLKQAVFTEMIRIIREEQPAKPSTRLSTEKSLPSLAAVRKIEPGKLAASFRGELDWIVMKCLEKPRDRRYETANALLRDIQRYLADEPVEARPPSVPYRLRKFMRRNKGPVIATALVALALVFGLLGTTIGMLRAWKAEGDSLRALEVEKDSKRRAVAAETAALHQAATSTFEKALHICEQGDAPQGLLWLADSLDLGQRAGDASLVEAIRHNLAAWSAECCELSAILQLDSNMPEVAFSPDNQTVFGVGADDSVLAWNVATGVRLPLGLPHPQPVSSLIVDPSGKRLYTLCQDGVVRRWAIPDGNLEASTENLYENRPDRQVPPTHHELMYHGLALHPSGNVMAVATTAGIQIRDAVSLEVVGNPFPNLGSCYQLTFDASGEYLWAAYAGVEPMLFPKDRRPRLLCWKVSNRSIVGRPLTIGIPIRLAAHPLKFEVGVGCWQGNSVIRYDAEGECQPRQGHFGEVRALAYDPTGRFLAAGGDDNSIRFWNAEGSRAYAPNIRLPSRLTSLAFARHNGLLAAGRQGGGIRLYRVPPPLGKQAFVGGWQMGLDVNPEGNRLLSCDFGTKVFLRDDQLNPLPTRMPDGLSGQHADCGFAIGGRIAYLGYTEPQLKVWDSTTSKIEFATPVPYGACRLAIGGHGLLGLVGGGFVGGSLGQACCVDLVTGEIRARFPDAGNTRYVTLSEDGRIAAIADTEGTVQLWDSRTGERIGSPCSHAATVTAIALSPCNRFAATGTDAGVLRLWRLPEWHLIGKPMSYDAEVCVAAFSRDSKLLAAAARDGTLRLWHAASQMPIGRKVTHGDAVSSVKFAPDGASFYTASRDYHLRRVQMCRPWQGDAKAVLRRAELIAGLAFDANKAIQPLTESQYWERAGSTPYFEWSATANFLLPQRADPAGSLTLQIKALQAEITRRADAGQTAAVRAYQSRIAELEAKLMEMR